MATKTSTANANTVPANKTLDVDGLSLKEMNEVLAKVQDRIVQGRVKAKVDLVGLVKQFSEDHGLTVEDIRESLGPEFFPSGVNKAARSNGGGKGTGEKKVHNPDGKCKAPSCTKGTPGGLAWFCKEHSKSLSHNEQEAIKNSFIRNMGAGSQKVANVA